jgi:hypothetical protein
MQKALGSIPAPKRKRQKEKRKRPKSSRAGGVAQDKIKVVK